MGIERLISSPDLTAEHFGAAKEVGRQAAMPVVEHRGWREARDRTLAALAAGPALVAVLGPAGTGKTWLLRATLAAARERGLQADFVLQGDLLSDVAAGVVVLVDEAARMDAERLAHLAGRRGATTVLAGLPEFAARLEPFHPRVTVVPLVPLLPAEVPGFVTGWLARQGMPADTVDAGAIARLVAHSGGVPRLVSQLLRAALAMAEFGGRARIGAEQVDEVAAFRLGLLDAPTAAGAAPSVAPPAAAEADYAPDLPASAAPGRASQPVLLSQVRDAVAAPAGFVAMVGAGSPARPDAHPLPRPAEARRRRLGRAGRAAALPALAASVLLGVVLWDASGRRLHGIATDAAAPQPELSGERPTPDVQPALPAQRAEKAVPDTADVPPAAAEFAGAEIPPILPNEAAPGPASHPSVVPAPEEAHPEPRTRAVASLPAPEPADASAGPFPAPGAHPDADPLPAPEPSLPAPLPSGVPSPAPAFAAVVRDAPASEVPAADPAEAAAAPPAAPSQVPMPSEPPGTKRRGGPGLVLVAQAGDTMPALYAKVYRGVKPPPYEDFVAANRTPFRPGAIVVFPTPSEGWSHR